jgi:hypothetical protein
MFPYSLALPFAFFARRPEDDPSTRSFERFVKISVIVILGFFTIVAKKYPWYVMPSYPFIACLVARWLTSAGRWSPHVRNFVPLAIVLYGALGIQFDPPIENPFSDRYFSFPRPRLDPSARASFLAGVAAFAFLTACQGVPRIRRIASSVAAVVIVAVGVARSVAPLRFTTYMSPTAILARDLNRRALSGEHISFPILLTGRNWKINEFYFGENFIIARPGLFRKPRLEGLRERPATAPSEDGTPPPP